MTVASSRSERATVLASLHRRVAASLSGVAYGLIHSRMVGIFEDPGRDSLGSSLFESPESAGVRTLGLDADMLVLVQIMRAERDGDGPPGGYLRAPGRPGSSRAFVDAVAWLAARAGEPEELDQRSFAEATRARRVLPRTAAGRLHAQLVTHLPAAVGRATRHLSCSPRLDAVLLAAAGFADAVDQEAFVATCPIEGVPDAVVSAEVEEFPDYPGEYSVRLRLQAPQGAALEGVEARLINFGAAGDSAGDTGWVSIPQDTVVAATLVTPSGAGRVELRARGFSSVEET